MGVDINLYAEGVMNDAEIAALARQVSGNAQRLDAAGVGGPPSQTDTATMDKLKDLHAPEPYMRRVPTFDAFDNPIERGTQCKACRNHYWPCETAKLLDPS